MTLRMAAWIVTMGFCGMYLGSLADTTGARFALLGAGIGALCGMLIGVLFQWLFRNKKRQP